MCASPLSKWDEQEHQCVHLIVVYEDGDLKIHACAVYDQIVGQPWATLNPAFGAGCPTPNIQPHQKIIKALVSRRLPLTVLPELKKLADDWGGRV